MRFSASSRVEMLQNPDEPNRCSPLVQGKSADNATDGLPLSTPELAKATPYKPGEIGLVGTGRDWLRAQ